MSLDVHICHSKLCNLDKFSPGQKGNRGIARVGIQEMLFKLKFHVMEH